MQTRQYVDGRAADLDVLAVAMQGSQACVLLLAFRDGRKPRYPPVLPTHQWRGKPGGSAGGLRFAVLHRIRAAARDPARPRVPDADLLVAALSASAERKVCS